MELNSRYRIFILLILVVGVIGIYLYPLTFTVDPIICDVVMEGTHCHLFSNITGTPYYGDTVTCGYENVKCYPYASTYIHRAIYTPEGLVPGYYEYRTNLTQSKYGAQFRDAINTSFYDVFLVGFNAVFVLYVIYLICLIIQNRCTYNRQPQNQYILVDRDDL